jgi:hypothetical protein
MVEINPAKFIFRKSKIMTVDNMVTGKWLTLAGIVIVIIGLLMTYAPGLISWFGKLPGDIRIGDEKRLIFIPITSMLIVSIVLSLLMSLFFRK